MVLCLPFLGLLPWYYHVIFYEIFLKIMVKNGNRVKNGGVKMETFMVEKNGSIFYFPEMEYRKWYLMVVKVSIFN
jgi:hypothetical protein